LLQQQRFEKLAASIKQTQDRQQKEKTDQEKKKALTGELQKLRDQYKLLKEAFESDGFDINTIDQSPEFNKMLDDIDRNKDLIKFVFERQNHKEELLLRIKVLEGQLEVRRSHSRPCDSPASRKATAWKKKRNQTTTKSTELRATSATRYHRSPPRSTRIKRRPRR